MIVCKNCEFEVKSSMRHSLVKNCCPCCGAALLGDIHSRRLEILKRKILEQEFSQNLGSDVIFDMAMFILSEFFSSVPAKKEEEGESDEADSLEGDSLQELNEEEDYESIRDEVRSEIMSNISDDAEDSDVDLKVARLKRIAKESKTRNSGASVRRVES